MFYSSLYVPTSFLGCDCVLTSSVVNSITSSKSVFSFKSSGSSGLLVNAASTYKNN